MLPYGLWFGWYQNPRTEFFEPLAPLVLIGEMAKMDVRVGSCDCGDDGSTKKRSRGIYPTRPSPPAGVPSIKFRWQAGQQLDAFRGEFSLQSSHNGTSASFGSSRASDQWRHCVCQMVFSRLMP